MFRVIMVALGFAFSAGAGLAQTSPLWGSDQIRQQRPTAAVEALVFNLHSEATSRGKPTKVTDQIVTLTPSFSLVAEGDRLTLDDHALCRALVWTERAASLENHSCYAGPAFRDLEIRNRVMMAQVIAKTGVVDQPQYIALSETELGVAAPGAGRLEARQTADGAEYRLGNAVMARVSGSAGEVSAEEMRRVTRFLANRGHLHPQVRRALAEGGHLPGLIEEEMGPIRVGDSHEAVRISNLRRAQVAYPLPAGLSSALSEKARGGTSPRDLAVLRAAAVIEGAAPRPTIDDTLAALRKAAADGRDLEVVLLFLELTQEHPAFFKQAISDEKARAVVTAIMPVVRSHMTSPNAAALMQANALASNREAKGDRQAAARFPALTPKMDAMAFGTFRHVTYANLVAVSPDSKDWEPAIRAAMPAQRVDNYWIHIAAYPWSSNAYKDAGDAYYAEYDTPQAWVAFDIGRLVDPEWREGPLATLANYEENLRAQRPDFF